MEPFFASTLLDSLHRIRPSLAAHAMTRMPCREREGRDCCQVFACLSATADVLFVQFMLGRDLIAAPVLTPQDPASSATQVPAPMRHCARATQHARDAA